MRGRLYNEHCEDSFQSSAMTCEKQCISGTSCGLHIMTEIIGSLMGSLALSIQPTTPFRRTGGKQDQSLPCTCCKTRDAFQRTSCPHLSLSLSVSLSLSFAPSLIHTGPWRHILGDSYTCPSHTFSLPHTPSSPPLSVHLHSQLVDKPRITM